MDVGFTVQSILKKQESFEASNGGKEVTQNSK